MGKDNSKEMVIDCLALLMAVRCRSKEATLQLLAKFYHKREGKELHTMMNRTIYMLTPKERDWMKSLA